MYVFYGGGCATSHLGLSLFTVEREMPLYRLKLGFKVVVGFLLFVFVILFLVFSGKGGTPAQYWSNLPVLTDFVLNWLVWNSSDLFRTGSDQNWSILFGGLVNWKPPKADSTWQFYQFWFSSNNIGSNAPLKLHLLGIISLQRAKTCFILLLQRL